MIVAIFAAAAIGCADHAYTVAQIDQMRAAVAVKLRPPDGQPYYAQELAASVEEQLRTYLCAGIEPKALQADADETLQRRLNQEAEQEAWLQKNPPPLPPARPTKRGSVGAIGGKR